MESRICTARSCSNRHTDDFDLCPDCRAERRIYARQNKEKQQLIRLCREAAQYNSYDTVTLANNILKIVGE